MELRTLDLDGALLAQPALLRRQSAVITLRDWGPFIRLGCGFRRFRRFEADLADRCGARGDSGPCLSLIGSGDFHHASLALVRRLTTPFNLLAIDNHPDWMRGIPFLHCGTWLWHASRLPLARTIYHVGGDVDFDNGFRHLAPWQALASGKIVVFPAVRQYRAGRWPIVSHTALRPQSDTRTTAERIVELLRPHAADLARWPLYVSLDKDVMQTADAVVNWDSGHLELSEVQALLRGFVRAAAGRLAGMDIVGDWSPVVVRGWLRRLLHATEHPSLFVQPEEADAVNDRTNEKLLDTLAGLGVYVPSPASRKAAS